MTKKKAATKKKTAAKKTAKKSSAKVKRASSVTEAVETAEDALTGKKMPAFSLDSTSGKKVSLQDLAGKRAVLYFYPKDNTPGCTLEGHDFRRLHKDFQRTGAEIFGVSRDSIKSHEKFAEGCGFPFQLLSDPNDELMKPLGVIGKKKLYGREYEGIIRTTVLVDEQGKIRKVWRNVKVNGHADEVLGAAKNL